MVSRLGSDMILLLEQDQLKDQSRESSRSARQSQFNSMGKKPSSRATTKQSHVSRNRSDHLNTGNNIYHRLHASPDLVDNP